MSVQAWFSRSEVDVAPGSVTVLQLTVVNLGTSTDTFTINPIGLAAGWTTVHPATVTLFGGSQEDVSVEVHPPLLPSTTAGPTSLSVRIVPESSPDDIGTAEITLEIGSSFDRRLYILQPALRARRTATYELMLENRGNAPASCRLHLLDPSGRVDADFDPPAAGVEPGASSLIRVKVRATRLQWERRSRTVPFRVDADQPGSPTASAPATFVQAPVVPEHFWERLIGVAVAAVLLVVAWFGLVRPAIDNAAADAVAELAPAPTTTVGTGTGTGPITTVATTLPPTAIDNGRPFAGRLAPEVAPGQTGSQVLTVPAGQRLQVTDLILQNPSTDTGTARLLRGSDVLFTWRLDYILTDVPMAFVTPIEVGSGEQLIFEVTCTGAGDSTLGVCAPALQTLGLLVPNQ